MKSAGKARNNGLYRHIRTSKEIIRNLLNDFDKHFNPRSPHGERRPQTSPCKGGWDFNPRSPHGERQVKARAVNQSKDISIHAPRTGSDQRGEDRHYYIRHFNPRSPHGERRGLSTTECG